MGVNVPSDVGLLFEWIINTLSFLLANSKAALEADMFTPTLTHRNNYLASTASGYRLDS
jgi:hypothetical protein